MILTHPTTKRINTEHVILFTSLILGLAYIATSLTLLTQL